ncbi:MAG: CBS domain-containing protein [Candidatus Cloacimonetes bacterium]|nr:CBS domain-containing protein [Candidatus Cloacimonadota bacterium]MBL7149489.1 CBS domain-containing protein [Candidatus Cloacimonadota bacterium]
MEIKTYMQKDVKTCTENETIDSVAKIMSTYDIGSVVVVKDDIPIGIFTERDLLKRVVASGKNPKKLLVREVMTKELITVASNEKLKAVYHVFVTNHIRHLPVMENGQLAGIISLKDIARVVDQQIFGLRFNKVNFSGDY